MHSFPISNNRFSCDIMLFQHLPLQLKISSNIHALSCNHSYCANNPSTIISYPKNSDLIHKVFGTKSLVLLTHNFIFQFISHKIYSGASTTYFVTFRHPLTLIYHCIFFNIKCSIDSAQHSILFHTYFCSHSYFHTPNLNSTLCRISFLIVIAQQSSVPYSSNPIFR